MKLRGKSATRKVISLKLNMNYVSAYNSPILHGLIVGVVGKPYYSALNGCQPQVPLGSADKNTHRDIERMCEFQMRILCQSVAEVRMLP